MAIGDIRLGLPSALALAALVGAASFAAGRAMPSSSAPSSSTAAAQADDTPAPMATREIGEGTDPAAGSLPPGHPRIDDTAGDPNGAAPPVAPPAQGGAGADEATLTWKVPARWQSAPNTSSMRLATYRVPRAAGDPADGDLSIVRAGGTPDANADRWIAQFDPAAQKTAKRSARKVAGLDVLVVDVQGTYGGGMGGDGAHTGWALLGAIVSTPDTSYFFKLTGPAKTVAAARPDFDALVKSFAPAAGADR